MIRRRDFLKATAVTFTLIPRHAMGGPGATPPSERLAVACLGVGGKGYFDLIDVSRTGANIVALCDVDSRRGGTAFAQFPKAKRYEDYRRLLDEQEKHIDAVVIATPDHAHMPANIKQS